MDLQSMDATLIKYLMQTMFNGTIITISPYSMPINLEPFIIFVVIKYFPFEYQQIG